MNKLQDKYPDFKKRFAKKVEETSSANVTFSAVVTLAELLHDKGLIEYEDFIERVYEDLGK